MIMKNHTMALVNEPGVEDPNTNTQKTRSHSMAAISMSHRTYVTRAFSITFLIFRSCISAAKEFAAGFSGTGFVCL